MSDKRDADAAPKGRRETRIPAWLRALWWGALLGFFSYLLVVRREALVAGQASTSDIIVLLAWLALALAPLFPEVSVFGLTLKREIRSARDDLGKQIASLRNEVRMNVRTEQVTQLNINPPSDKAIERRMHGDQLGLLRDALGKTVGERLDHVADRTEMTTSPDVQYLFAVRYNIERELRRLWASRMLEAEGHRKHPTWRQMVMGLAETHLLVRPVTREVSDLMLIANRVIHGEQPSPQQMEYARKLAPVIVDALRHAD